MSRVVIERAVVLQALEAMEAMQSYAASERKGLRICDEAIPARRAALAAQGCYITQDITRQEYERLYPDAEEEVTR